MYAYEQAALKNGCRHIAGVDEAGRGPLAGPVVASAVIFSKANPPLGSGIKDSKKLTASRRAALSIEICRRAISVGVGVVWPADIDAINIHKASLLAMSRAVVSLDREPDLLLIDGLFPIESKIPQQPIVSGDALSISIAAASIIAKTLRDDVMHAYHRIYPAYNFASNKGYGTKEHIKAIALHGPCPIHRRSFKGVL
ncbi:MAG: ribonuclease HII [Deltaproteobacteria bacterium]|nr:ribonuclease HII [Deltaproteobacteria bacterium]